MGDNKQKKNPSLPESVLEDLTDYLLEDRNEKRYQPMIIETPFGEYTVSVTLSLN